METSFVIKLTHRKSGETVYLKCPRPISETGVENLEKWLDQITRLNPDFAPEEAVAHAVERMNQSRHYATIQVVDKPWDVEAAYGEAEDGDVPQEPPPRPQKLTFHVRCMAECMTEITFSRGNVTLEEAMAYAKAHVHELDTFYPPKITAALEVIDGSGYLAEDPASAQVVCIDANFTASPATARCVKFSRALTDDETEYFRRFLQALPDATPEDNDGVVTCAVEAFNRLAAEQNWDVTAEKLDKIEPWNSMIAYGHDFEPGLGQVVRIR